VKSSWWTYEFARSANNASYHDISERQTLANKVFAASQDLVEDIKELVSLLSRSIDNVDFVEAMITNRIKPVQNN
jgi:hypothetical protein